MPSIGPPADLDDRPAGDDALLLVPLLQPAESRRQRLGGLRELPVLPHRSGLLAGDPQHARHRARRARRSPSSAASPSRCCIDQPIFGQGIVRILVISPFFVMPPVAALVWKNMIMHPGYGVARRHRQVPRPAAGRLVRQLPAVLDHHHRRLAVAALRDADPAHLAAVARRASRRRRPRWTAPASGSRFMLPDAAAHGPRHHRRHPDPDDLPARASTPRSSSPPTAARATPRPTCRSSSTAPRGSRHDVGGAAAGGIVAVVLANIVAIFLMRAVGKNLD